MSIIGRTRQIVCDIPTILLGLNPFFQKISAIPCWYVTCASFLNDEPALRRTGVTSYSCFKAEILFRERQWLILKGRPSDEETNPKEENEQSPQDARQEGSTSRGEERLPETEERKDRLHQN
jgi:hypothetical protein